MGLSEVSLDACLGEKMGLKSFFERIQSLRESYICRESVPVFLCKVAEVMTVVLFGFLHLSYEKV